MTGNFKITKIIEILRITNIWKFEKVSNLLKFLNFLTFCEIFQNIPDSHILWRILELKKNSYEGRIEMLHLVLRCL